jgi:alkanesulfonate monooxygenase SsuD/methylene tetrahydromethanopterin reductase-like flavin-dependent oxidoreductase (luciferase family)
MAQQALTVHDVAPGRLRLGIGPSIRACIEDVYGLQYTSPLPHLKEYLEVLRGLLWEGSIDHHGTFFNVVYTLPRTAQVPLLISALGLKAFRLAGEVADGVLPAMCPLPYLLNQALPALRAGAEARNRPVPPIIAALPVVLSTDEAAVLAAVRPSVQMMTQVGPYAQMFVQAGFAGAVDGDEAALDALTQSLVISGDEATVRNRVQELLASGLDELVLGLVPVADEARERKQLLHLIGSLEA